MKKAEKLFILQDGKFELDLSYFDYYLFDKKKYFFNIKFKKLFGEPRKKNEKIEKMTILCLFFLSQDFQSELGNRKTRSIGKIGKIEKMKN